MCTNLTDILILSFHWFCGSPALPSQTTRGPRPTDWESMLWQGFPILVLRAPSCPACFRCFPATTHLIQMNGRYQAWLTWHWPNLSLPRRGSRQGLFPQDRAPPGQHDASAGLCPDLHPVGDGEGLPIPLILEPQQVPAGHPGRPEGRQAHG